MSVRKLNEFKQFVWDYYHENKRELPWRKEITPYKIVISEVMLQQTQVSRIISKYHKFLELFPDFQALAQAPLKDLLMAWQGIGYNRRALYLQKMAQIIVNDYKNILPDEPDVLDSFPGLGPATAASIVVYAYNKPVPFIETNIRRIYIHHFFEDLENIDDKEILPIVEKTIDKENPREWYYALMDYGTMLAKTIENPNRRSKHYVIQSPLEGSDRQVRSKILRLLLVQPQTSLDLVTKIQDEKQRVPRLLTDLLREGFVTEQDGLYVIE